MGKGYFELSHDLLREVLNLPYNAKINSVSHRNSETCYVWVEHPDIPELDNSVLARVLAKGQLFPIWHKQEPVVFEGWGIDEE